MASRRIHPGLRVALDKLGMDELGVAEAIAAGELVSPQRYMNVTLFAIRITGVGAAYRQALNEYVWRDPKFYLNDRFLKRCQGLAVVMSHPKKNALDTQEYRDRNIGAIMFAWIKGNEVWGIAKVHDDVGAAFMNKFKDRLSTSPAVVFKPIDGNRKLDLEDGSSLLIEGDPSLLDHIAICEEGVWDKGGEPTGVQSTEVMERADSQMTDSTDGQKLDQLLTAMDNISGRLDAVEGKVTARDTHRDDGEGKEGCPPEMAEKLDDDAAKRDDADESEPAELSEMPEATAADKSRKDAARAHWKGRRDVYKRRRADAAKKDGELPEDLKKEIADAATKHDEMPPELAARAGDRKDAATKHFADRRDAHRRDAELPEDLKKTLDDDAKGRRDEDEGEPEMLKKMDGARGDAARAHWRSRRDSYRSVRRDAAKPLAERLQNLEARMPKLLTDADREAFADAQARADSAYHAFGKKAPRPMDGEDLVGYRRRLVKEMQDHSPAWKGMHIGSLGADVLDRVEEQVYADAMVAARSPNDVPEGELRETITKDRADRNIHNFVGRPSSWMNDFSSGFRVVEKFNNS